MKGHTTSSSERSSLGVVVHDTIINKVTTKVSLATQCSLTRIPVSVQVTEAAFKAELLSPGGDLKVRLPNLKQ